MPEVSGAASPYPPVSTRLAAAKPSRVAAVIVVVSLLACAGLLVLVYGLGERDRDRDVWSNLPILNAALNAACAMTLVVGYRAIKGGNIDAHRRAMFVAFGFSVAFLVSYLTHHALHGDTTFEGAAAVKAIYLVILASHVLLSIVALPMILGTLFAALAGSFDSHRRLARLTLPVWLYVSVTGVIVVVLLRALG